MHPLAAMLGETRAVLIQRETPHKTNETTAPAPLLDGLDLPGMPVAPTRCTPSAPTPAISSRTKAPTTH